MTRSLLRLARAAVWVWPPLVVGVGIPLAFSQTPGTPSGYVSFSLESIGVLVGIVAVVAPAFYFAGRFNQRMTVVEKDLEKVTEQMSGLIEVNTEAANRLASAVENLTHRYPYPTSG